MSVEAITLLLVLSFIGLLLTGLPVAFCLMSLSLIFFLIFLHPKYLYIAFSAQFGVITNEIYLAGPLFIFMAMVLQSSGIISALYEAIYKWSGSLRGSLAIASVGACTIIAAMTGIGGTGVVTMGVLAYPEMRKRKYANTISLGCIPAGGALGPIIPPSIVMILVGGLGLVSIGKLFMAGILPGLLISFLFIVYIGVRSLLQPSTAPALLPEERPNWKEKFSSLRGVIFPMILIVLVLGGIYTGACTPTEAGGVAAVGALVCTAINRQLTWSNLKSSLFGALRVNAMVMWLLIGGCMFGGFMSASGVKDFIGELLLVESPSTALILMLAIAIIMGMFVDAGTVTIICIPLFMPIIKQFGIDPIFFGLLFTLAAVIGYISPPFGMNLFYMKGLVPEDVTMTDIYRSVLPYFALMLIALAACVVFPIIPLCIPNMMP